MRVMLIGPKKEQKSRSDGADLVKRQRSESFYLGSPRTTK